MEAGLAVAAAIWLVALCRYDIRQRRLPDALTVPGAAVVLLVALCCGAGPGAALGAAGLGAVYLLMHVLSPSGMGAGDVKLAVGLGALTGAFGFAAWTLAAVAGPALTATWGLLTRRRVVPHGPAMCLASALSVAAHVVLLNVA